MFLSESTCTYTINVVHTGIQYRFIQPRSDGHLTHSSVSREENRETITASDIIIIVSIISQVNRRDIELFNYNDDHS